MALKGKTIHNLPHKWIPILHTLSYTRTYFFIKWQSKTLDAGKHLFYARNSKSFLCIVFDVVSYGDITLDI